MSRAYKLYSGLRNLKALDTEKINLLLDLNMNKE